MLQTAEVSDRLDKLADRVTLLFLACEGLEHQEDAAIIGHELFNLAHAIKTLSIQIHPMNVNDEIACAQRQFDSRVETIKEQAEREANAEEAVAELEAL